MSTLIPQNNGRNTNLALCLVRMLEAQTTGLIAYCNHLQYVHYLTVITGDGNTLFRSSEHVLGTCHSKSKKKICQSFIIVISSNVQIHVHN